MRIGGLVKTGSLVKSEGQKAAFTITDNANNVAVTYQGLLPDLFREGQGVVAEGVLTGRASSAPITCSPNMTSAICRAKWSMR